MSSHPVLRSSLTLLARPFSPRPRVIASLPLSLSLSPQLPPSHLRQLRAQHHRQHLTPGIQYFAVALVAFELDAAMLDDDQESMAVVTDLGDAIFVSRNSSQASFNHLASPRPGRFWKPSRSPSPVDMLFVAFIPVLACGAFGRGVVAGQHHALEGKGAQADALRPVAEFAVGFVLHEYLV